MKIIISGKISAYGMYIRKLFDKKNAVSIKNNNPKAYKRHKPTALPIFIVTDLSQIAFLKGALENYFEKAIICSDIDSVGYLSISKPHVFVSLNRLKNEWMNEVLDATFKLLGDEAAHLLNKKNSIVINYLTTLKEQQQNQW